MNTGNVINRNELVDINDIVINPALDKEKRIQSFVEQIKNPLCYKCVDYVVKISFAEGSKEQLTDALKIICVIYRRL